jgi:hypothetical protein
VGGDLLDCRYSDVVRLVAALLCACEGGASVVAPVRPECAAQYLYIGHCGY